MANEVQRTERRLARWDPFREMADMERRFRGTMADLLDWRFPALWSRRFDEELWAPSVELIDHEDKYIVRAELPGMTKDEIDVSIGEEGLVLSGEKKARKDIKEEEYIYREHVYGSFRRIIPFPTAIDADKVEAVYENGVLEVTVPKSSEARVKKIEISTKPEAK